MLIRRVIFVIGSFLLGSINGYPQGLYVTTVGSQFLALENIEGKSLSSGISGGLGFQFENSFFAELEAGYKNLTFQSQSKPNSVVIFSGLVSLGYAFDFENNFRLLQSFGASYSFSDPKTEVYQFSGSNLSAGGFSRTLLQFLVSPQFSVSQITEYHVLDNNKLTSVKIGDFTSLLIFGVGVTYYFDDQKYTAPSVSESLDYYATQYDNSDRDFDGIPDYKDNCPDVPGTKEKYGCPDSDNDSDGILNDADGCIEEAETFNDFQDEDGCPDSIPVVRVDEMIESPKEQAIIIPAPSVEVMTVPIVSVPVAKTEIPKDESSEFSELKITFKGSPSALKRDQVEMLMSLDKTIKTTKGFKWLELNIYCWDQVNQTENKRIADKRLKTIVDFMIHSGLKSDQIKTTVSTKKHNKGDGQYYEYQIVR